ncbi:MAG: hypothetical protein RLZZ385_1226 [Pseudomonadota bacterium]
MPIEEITVVGEKTLIGLRHEIEREEDNLYRLFNDLNSNDDMDIKCRIVRKSNSHISARQCEPVFFSKLRTSSNRNALAEIRSAWSNDGIDPVLLGNAMDTLESDSELRAKAAPDFELLSEEMLRIATEHPDYLQSLRKIAELKANFEQERARHFGKE